jgi:hypothetical protein
VKPAEATFPGKNGRIAYERNYFVIYTINPNGSGKTKVTNTGVSPSLGDYSSDGKKITYTDYRGNNDNDEEIYTINSNGTGKFQLTKNRTNDYDPSYSPNGMKIAFASDVGNYPDYDSEIYTMNVHGKNRVRLTNNAPNDFGPDYSPNGKRIAYYDCDGNDNEIVTISAHGGHKFRVTKGAFPSYSPDGKKIAYTRGHERNGAIYAINVGGGGKSKVTEGSNPSWGASSVAAPPNSGLGSRRGSGFGDRRCGLLEMEYTPAEVDQVVVCEVGDPVLEVVCERAGSWYSCDIRGNYGVRAHYGGEEAARGGREAAPTPCPQRRRVLCVSPSVADGLECATQDALRQGTECRYRQRRRGAHVEAEGKEPEQARPGTVG